ncbi:hypothetical protein ARMGADRAFT_1061841 [Armillaria gallica]|uniref:Uncharacterized protein n=1 Tax=Armillaria gallica TaxID=47427 RepID=A0A2H3E183_ARMGA|nr:hypothetical protein ARMGADRAFT_1061841 [Armillaria gallica]
MSSCSHLTAFILAFCSRKLHKQWERRYLYICITTSLFFYQRMFFLLLSSWRISAPLHIKFRRHTYASTQTSTSPYHSTQGSQRRSTMEHHKEEHDDLLRPSGSNDDPSFPASATLSEACPTAGHSSSSATLAQPPLDATQRIRLGGTPGVIAGLLFGAALAAVLHHVYLFILRGHTVSGQFWIKNSSNALNPLRILRLASSRRVSNAIPVIIIPTLLQAFALVSILAPNSLEVGSASPKYTTISVPTALFNEHINDFDSDCSVPYLSADGEKVLGHALAVAALQSETLIGWNAPAGCGTACNYTIQYSVPALRRTELAIDEVNTMLPASQLTVMGPTRPTTVYPVYTVYNASTRDVGGSIELLSIAWRTYDTNGTSTVAGTYCSLYNTTQQSVVSFVNNTGMISPSIISYHSPVNIDNDTDDVETCPESSNSTSTSVSLYTYVVIWRWLYEQLDGDLTCRLEQSNGTQARCMYSTESEFKVTTNNLFSVNQTEGTFTSNNKNISSALEQILVNLTVALITYWGQTTMVDASVTQGRENFAFA